MSPRGDSNDTPRYLPLLIAPPVLWGGNFVVGRLVSPELSAEWLNLLRWVVAALVVLPFSVSELLRERAALVQNFPKLALLSLLGVIGFNTTLYLALQHVTAMQAATGFAITPFVILFLNACIDQRLPDSRIVYAGLVSFIGVFIIFHHAVQGMPTGEWITVGLLLSPPILIWSFYCLTLKRARLTVTPLSSFSAQIIIGVTLQGSYLFATLKPLSQPVSLGSETFVALVYLGVFASVAAFYCWHIALTQFSTEQAGIAMNLVPISSILLAWLFIDETLSGPDILGVAMVFAGLFLSHRVDSIKRGARGLSS